jgi:hypothetical protein
MDEKRNGGTEATNRGIWPGLGKWFVAGLLRHA